MSQEEERENVLAKTSMVLVKVMCFVPFTASSVLNAYRTSCFGLLFVM